MSVAILYDGMPVELPAERFPPESLLYDVYGFLWRFSIKTTTNGVAELVSYRYYTLLDFRVSDRGSRSVLEGYYSESQYMDYVRPIGFGINDRVGIQALQSFDFSAYIAKVGTSMRIEKLHDAEDYLYYFSKMVYEFTVGSNEDGISVRNYLKKTLINNIDYLSEIDTPDDAIATKYIYAETGSPEGIFFAHNFRGHFAYNGTNEVLKSRYKHVFTLIAFQIHYLVTDILDGKLVADGIIVPARVDNYAQVEDIVTIDSFATAFERLVFLLKRSWCYYYDPALAQDPNYPNRHLPPSVLETMQIEDLWRYYSGLVDLYNTIYRSNLRDFTGFDQDRLLLDIVFAVPDVTLITFPYDGLMIVARALLNRSVLNEREEQILVKVVIAMANLSGREDQFLDFLATIDHGNAITNFEVLYELLDDARAERYTIVNWFVDEKPNRRYFVYALYEMWKRSKYNWELVRTEPSNRVSFWDDYAQFNEHVVIEVLSNPSQASIQQVDTGMAKRVYDFDTQVQGVFVSVDACVGYDDFVVLRPNLKNDELTSDVTRKARYESLGNYHLYQPVLLLNYVSNPELEEMESRTFPAFMLHYMREYDKIRDFDAEVDFGINMLIEAALFFGTGGLTTIRHLRHLRYINLLGRALSRSRPMDPNTAITVWRGVTAGAESISMTAGVLANVGVYLETTENDPDKREFWQKMQVLMLFATVLSAGGSLRANALTSRAAREAYEAYIRLPAGTVIDPDVAELIGFFNMKLLADVNAFDNLLINSDVMLLRDWFMNDPRMTRSYQQLFMNHYGLAKVEELKLLNDTQVLDTWYRLAEAGVDRPLRQVSVVVELSKNYGTRGTRVIQLYENIDARKAFENLDPQIWKEMLNTFIFKINASQSNEVIARILQKPQLMTDLLKTHFDKVKRADLDKLSVDNIFDIMRANLHDAQVQFLIVKNTRSRAKMTRQFRRQLASHETISKERITALMDGTAPELNKMNELLKPDAYKMNVMLVKVEVYDGNSNTWKIPENWDVYLSSQNPVIHFEDGQLPPIVKDISPSSRARFKDFKARAIDGDGKNRVDDTEMKFIFHFLEEFWDLGDRFVIRIESALKVCSSCEAYLAYLQDLGRQYGKDIQIYLKDNEKMLGIESLKEL